MYERLDGKRSKDLRVLAHFVAVYCREHHGGEEKVPFPMGDLRLRDALGDKELALCADCTRLLQHGTAKLLLCPYDPKPKCKDCETQCYAPGYRERVREVMRFSGVYLVRRGRLDLLAHYLF